MAIVMNKLIRDIRYGPFRVTIKAYAFVYRVSIFQNETIKCSFWASRSKAFNKINAKAYIAFADIKIYGVVDYTDYITIESGNGELLRLKA